MWKRQVAPAYLFFRQSGSGVTLTYTGVSRKSFGTQHGSTYHSVAYVRLVTETADARCVAAYYAYIVQHGGLGYKVAVEVQLGM